MENRIIEILTLDMRSRCAATAPIPRKTSTRVTNRLQSKALPIELSRDGKNNLERRNRTTDHSINAGFHIGG